jgi:hypothetical protein
VEIHVESNPPALVQKIEFADKETYPFADSIFRLYVGGYLRAVSVGFLPLEMQPYCDPEDPACDPGTEFLSQELLELSAVPVPANPEALARCVQKGFAEADLVRVFEAPNVERELAELSVALSRLAVSVARATVREALVVLKAARLESSGDLTLEDLLDAVKQARTSKAETGGEITSIEGIEQLGEALKSGDGDAEFEKALGLGGEGEPETFSTSRKWRDPGRLRRE